MPPRKRGFLIEPAFGIAEKDLQSSAVDAQQKSVGHGVILL